MTQVTPKSLNDAKAGYYKPSLLDYLKGLFQSYTRQEQNLIGTNVTLLDISFYQLTANFNTMKTNGVDGVIIRAGQNKWVDTQAGIFMSDAARAGMPIGSYWFYDSRVSPQEQADKWASVLKDTPTQLYCWADYEENYGGKYAGWSKLYDFLEACKQKMPNRKFGIYTGYYYWVGHSPSNTASLNYFAQYPLWLAWYTPSMNSVKIPKPWTKMTMWQYTASGDGTKFGVGSKEVDMDLFTGTKQEFNKFFGLEDEPPCEPPTEPEEPPVTPPSEPETPQPALTKVRVVWDDENPDYGYKSRTQQKKWSGPKNPPAVYRFYPEMREQSGDYRVNMASPYDWKSAIVRVNGNRIQWFNYLTGRGRATYNKRGWPQQAYITMSGNTLEGEFVGDWFKFNTLKQSDVFKAGGMNINTFPQYVHRFTCVTWDKKKKTTKRIPSSGTPKGQVYYFLVTKEGVAYIPKRHVKAIV